jgi:predicted GIY-YIG superfamily endonuclease
MLGAGRSLNMGQRTALYRFYDSADELLYAGIAFDPRRRGYQHKKTKAWWSEVARTEISWHNTRTEAEAAEREAIAGERPRFNITGVDDPHVARPAERLRSVAAPPSALRNRLLNDVSEATTALTDAEAQVERIRRRLHARIRAAGNPELGEDRSGPSAIARAGRHRYTREYVGSLLKAEPPPESESLSPR